MRRCHCHNEIQSRLFKSLLRP